MTGEHEADRDRDRAGSARSDASRDEAGVRWEIPVRRPAPSAGEIERSFEELIRRRWRSGGLELPEGFAVGRRVVLELDLPGHRAAGLRAHLELRVERGVWRVRIRPEDEGGGAEPDAGEEP